MVRIHRSDLAGIVASLVCMAIVHVVWDTKFSKHAWVFAHIVETFFLDCSELIPEAIADRCLAKFNCEGRG